MVKIYFYISDYCENIEQCTIYKSSARIRRAHHTERTVYITIDPIRLVDLLLNLRFFPRFRLKIANALADQDTHTIQLIPPAKEHLDYDWGQRAVHMIWELVELTELMAWLSTLGGAFSALGDYQLACADTAGKISLHQMKLAFRLGDPSLVARAKLYLAISFIQRAEFASAKHIIQSVYRSARKQTEPETRLLKMCQGIWAKLRYEYDAHQRNVARKKT